MNISIKKNCFVYKQINNTQKQYQTVLGCPQNEHNIQKFQTPLTNYNNNTSTDTYTSVRQYSQKSLQQISNDTSRTNWNNSYNSINNNKSNKDNRQNSSKQNFSIFAELKNFIGKWFLPLGLVSALVVGISLPQPGIVAANNNGQNYSTMAIFVIAGMILKVGDVVKSLKYYPPLVFGLTSILILTPMFSTVMLNLPIKPEGLTLGLGVFCCVPTTLTMGLSLTLACKGNNGLALLLTLVSSLLSPLTVPFTLSLALGRTGNVHMDPYPLVEPQDTNLGA